MFVCIFLKPDVGLGQCGTNQIQNPNFLLGTPCTLPGNNGSSSFENGCVEGWLRASQSPHHAIQNPNSYSDVLCDIFNLPPVPYDGSEFTCIGSYEGIFQNVNILQNPLLSFQFSLDVAGLSCEKLFPGNTMEILITKNLTDQIPFFTLLNYPKQSLLVHTISNSIPTTLTTQFTVQQGSGFNQIWIRNRYPDRQTGMFTFDNAILTCSTNAISEITTSNLGNVFNFGATNLDSSCPFITYSWNFDDTESGALNNVSTLSDPSHIFSAPDTYNVCVDIIDCHGCCGSFCKLVTICEPPTPSFTATGCPNVTFTVTNQMAGNSYIWDFGDNTVNGTGNMINHSYNSNGIKEVKLTVTNSCGSVSITQNVEVNCIGPSSSCSNQSGCITIGTDINSQIRLSDLINGTNPIIPTINGYFGTRVIQGGCYSLKGRLIIDVMTDMRNTQWYCGPGATIEVKTWLFSATESIFQGCDQMWRGIIVTNDFPGSLISNGIWLANTRIQDAWRGVELRNKTGINAVTSQFIDNYVGVLLSGVGTSTQIISNSFVGCSFINKGQMLNSYPNQGEWAQRSYAGIQAYNVSLLNVNGLKSRNVFHNLSFGIKTFKTNLNISNNTFLVNDVTSKENRYFSAAIEMYNGSGVSVIKNNIIENVYEGVLSYNSQNEHISIFQNEFKGIAPASWEVPFRGFKISGAQNSTVDISERNSFSFDNPWAGSVCWVQNCIFKGFNFENNQVKSINENVEDGFGGLGYIDNISGSDLVFKNNVIESDALNGFQIYNSKDLNIINNNFVKINGYTPSWRSLFYTGNSDRLLFKKNEAEGYGTFMSAGAGPVGGSESTYCCNICTSPGNTIIFGGGNSLISNLFNNQIHALTLESGTIIGAQPSRGNIWNNSLSFAEISSYVPDQFYLILNRFNVDPDQPGHRPFHIIPANIQSDWFQTNGTSKECSRYQDCESPYGFINTTNNYGLNPISDENITNKVQNFVNVARYNDNMISGNTFLSRWANASAMYEYQLNYPQIDWNSKIDQYSREINYYDSNLHISNNIIQWKHAEIAKSNLYSIDENTHSIVKSNQEIINSKIKEITELESILGDSLNSTLSDLHLSIAEASDVIKMINNTVTQNVLVDAQNLANEILTLPEEFSFLVERKKIWTIEMKKIISGIASLTPVDWTEIRRIAALCPLEYGGTVYEAWGMLKLKGENPEDISIDGSCPTTTDPRTRDTRTADMLINPNPTTGTLHLNLMARKADGISFYNIFGNEVMHEVISDKTQVLDISNFENGVYFYKVSSENNVVFTGKVLKID